MKTILEVTLAEFSEVNDAIVSMSDSLFASWLVERFGTRCPDLGYGLDTVEVKVVGDLKVEHPRSVYGLEGLGGRN